VSITKKIKTLAVILTVAAAANAQFNIPASARISSLAGTPLGDITDVYAYPVFMTGYTDHISATWGGGVIGIKAINDMISIGILANQGYMAPGFADDAVNMLNSYAARLPVLPPGFDTLFTRFSTPHLLLGFDLGGFRLGADIFFEYAGARFKADPDGAPSMTAKTSVVHPGARLSAAIDVGDASVLAKFGVGFPSVNGEATLPVGAVDKLSSDAGLYMEMGGELRVPASDIDWTVGGDYTRTDHRFKVGSDSDDESICNSLFRMYLGGEFNFMETAVAAFRYRFERYAYTESEPDVSGNPMTSDILHRHIISAGMENAWEKVWLFDSVHLRGGALYMIEVEGGKASGSNFASSGSYPENHSRVVPTLGIGVSKAFFTLDLALNMGSWNGVLTGPGVALATATVKF
jgi:hypothetical protein